MEKMNTTKYQNDFIEHLLPKDNLFKPDIRFVSAGFDALKANH